MSQVSARRAMFLCYLQCYSAIASQLASYVVLRTLLEHTLNEN